jgi:hypothetical protein
MTRSVNLVEAVAFFVMAAWLLGQLLYTLPIPRLRRVIDRANAGLWFANWSVFGAGRERAEIATYTLEYRDRVGIESGEWIELIRGRPWYWHSFLWQPDRRIADRLHRLAEGIAQTVDFHSERAQIALKRRRRLVASYVDSRCPRASNVRRDIRITMKRASIAATVGAQPQRDVMRVETRVLWEFSVDADEY